jgi:hypothetical protein
MPTTINGFEDSNFPWVECEAKGDRMDGSRYYEYFKTFGDKRTHHIQVNDWRDTPHGGFWVTITDLRDETPNGTAFECSEFVEVAIILRSLV